MALRIQFFLKSKSGDFLPIRSFSEEDNLEYDGIFETILENIRAGASNYMCSLDKNTLACDISMLRNSIDECQKYIFDLQKQKRLVATFQNSIEEKNKYFEKQDYLIDETTEEIKTHEYLISFFETLLSAIENASLLGYDEEDYIYYKTEDVLESLYDDFDDYPESNIDSTDSFEEIVPTE